MNTHRYQPRPIDRQRAEKLLSLNEQGYRAEAEDLLEDWRIQPEWRARDDTLLICAMLDVGAFLLCLQRLDWGDSP